MAGRAGGLRRTSSPSPTRAHSTSQPPCSGRDHGKLRSPTCQGMSDSGPGRGFDCLRPAVRAPSRPLRDEQMPVDRHLTPRDAAERRLIRQGVLQSRGTCLPACREARRGKSEREPEESEVVTKMWHGSYPRTWPDQREVKGTGPSGCCEPAMCCLSAANSLAPFTSRQAPVSGSTRVRVASWEVVYGFPPDPGVWPGVGVSVRI